jgi:hypothetical protein
VKKDEMVIKNERGQHAVKKALWAVFPSVASFLSFREDDREISQCAIPGIIQYAFNHSVIDIESEAAFIDFLKNSSKPTIDHRLPDGLTFSDVLNTLTDNRSVNTLIAQLDKITQALFLPKIQAPMITRLKKTFLVNTPKKRVLLRILTFQLARKRPELNWHYELLLKLPTSSVHPLEQIQEKAGATIRFHLRGQEESIVPTDVVWLKNELAACIDYLHLAGYVHKKTIETTGATSFAIRSPKKPGALNEPRLYTRAIRNVLAIAHQMSARWLLNPHSSPRKRLLMTITAGPMYEAHPFDLLLPENCLTDDSGIYLTDFAYLCVGITDLKVGFRRYVSQNHSGSGYKGDIWSVTYFWPNHFYDYIPCLLEERMLPKSDTDPAYQEFRNTLHYPELNSRASFGAIAAMHRFPQNALLLIEITKVLRARQMPYEADAVLTNLLLSNPNNLAARFMRMLILCNIADIEPDYITSGLAFERGLAEGEYIVDCFNADSEIWCAMGVLYFGRAMKMLRYLRHSRLPVAQAIKKEDFLTSLQNAKECLSKGLTVSTTGQYINCFFWLQYALSFIDLFSTDEKLFVKSHSAVLQDNKNVFRQAGIRIFRNMGWMQNDLPSDREISKADFENVLHNAMLIFSRYENSMLGRSYIPYMQYLFGFILWDFAPHLTLSVCKAVLSLLESARLKAENLLQDNVCVYQVLACYIPADQFIGHVEQMTGLIRKFVTDDDLKKGEDFPMNRVKVQKMSKIKLMLLEVDRH